MHHFTARLFPRDKFNIQPPLERLGIEKAGEIEDVTLVERAWFVCLALRAPTKINHSGLLLFFVERCDRSAEEAEQKYSRCLTSKTHTKTQK